VVCHLEIFNISKNKFYLNIFYYEDEEFNSKSGDAIMVFRYSEKT